MIQFDEISMDFKSELNTGKINVLNQVSFSVEKGDCLGILGESGSGKSTMGKIIIGLLKPSSGIYTFDDVQPYASKSSKKHLASKISVVFQDYNTSVNPRFTIFEVLKESLRLFKKRNQSKLDLEVEISQLLRVVGLNDDFKKRYPHQLSGGQLQRVCIARAIAVKPEVILFDEAISSLDAHTQVQIMDLLIRLKQSMKLTYIFITHDLTSVTYLCNKVMFLYKGEVTEFLPVAELANTQDEYAQKLLQSIITI